MKKIFSYILPLIFCACSYSQSSLPRGEFAATDNGLMYSNEDMKVLRFIVDSLNLQYKTCDLNKVYYAQPQTTCSYISFESKTNNLRSIISDIKGNMSFADLMQKYDSLVDENEQERTVIKNREYTKDGKKGISYLEGNAFEGYDNLYIDEDNDINKTVLLKGWIYSYNEKDQYSTTYTLTCRYFSGDWKQPAIPEKYARLIQYVDCMIDTSASVFLTDNYESGWGDEDKKGYHNISELSSYINKKAGFTNKVGNNKSLNKEQISYASSNFFNDSDFKKILGETIDNYAAHKTADINLESLALAMNMYDKALLMKRCYQVIGMCSQDSRPREHARDIAKLAAQSHSWNIFLRAHLDIMNDRFSRMIDGSYAWDKRETYLKELEELNLNVIDLILGLILRADNVSDNHYYGTIWRLGKALSESKDKALFEKAAIEMLKDTKLDSFNQGLIFMVYTTYAGYLDKKEAKSKRDYLRDNISSFPEHIQEAIKLLKESKKDQS